MRKLFIPICLILALCVACATAPLDKAKQAGLASKLSCEASFALIVDAHKLGVVSDEDYLKADNLYDEYVVYQTQYALAIKLWEEGTTTPETLSVLQIVGRISGELADIVAAYHLKDGE